jgi:hypothetical protein
LLLSNAAKSGERTNMKKQKLPKGWTERKVKNVLKHYEEQTEDEAVQEDETAFSGKASVVTVPVELLPKVRKLIAQHGQRAKA